MRASPPGGQSTQRGNRVWSQEGGRPGWSCLSLANVFIIDNYRVFFYGSLEKCLKSPSVIYSCPILTFQNCWISTLSFLEGPLRKHPVIGSSVVVVFNHCFASVGMWRACKIKGKRHVGKPRASEVEEGNKDTSEWNFFTTFCHGRLIRTSSTTGLPPPSPSSDSLPDAFRPRFGSYLLSTLFSWSMTSLPLVTF